MKYLLTVILTCFVFKAFTQNQFEGKINYTVTSLEKNGNGSMNIYFGKPGVRLEFVEATASEKEQAIIIINLDSGKIYTLDPTEKNYKESVLKKKIQIPTSAKNIAGYKTTSVPIEALGTSRELLAVFSSSVLYPADDLFYKIPEMYEGNTELLMVNKGKVVLGGDFYLGDYSNSQWNLNNSMNETEQRQLLFSVLAEKITEEKLDSALFAVPANYSRKKKYDYSSDSAWVMPDTTVPYLADTTYMVDSPQQKAPAKNKKSSPKKKPAPVKQNALPPKKD